jgi:hypothetical protein
MQAILDFTDFSYNVSDNAYIFYNDTCTKLAEISHEGQKTYEVATFWYEYFHDDTNTTYDSVDLILQALNARERLSYWTGRFNWYVCNIILGPVWISILKMLGFFVHCWWSLFCRLCRIFF